MLACRIVNIFVTVLSVITIPLQFVTTTVGGCLVGCTFGLLLIPISLIWMVFFLGPLLATSWLWQAMRGLRFAPLVSIARIPVAIMGIPWAILAEVYVSLMPEAEREAKYMKLVTCWVWPFSLDFFRFYSLHRPIDSPDASARYHQLQEAAHIARAPLPPLLGFAVETPDENP